MIIAVDFDGTIVEHKYPRIGKDIPFAIETLIRLQHEFHHQIILWTVREGALLQEAVEYCESRGLQLYAANKDFSEEDINSPGYSRKLKADIFIDDRNIGGLPDWGMIYQMIATGTHRGGNFEEMMASAGSQRKSRRSSRNKNVFLRIGEAIEASKKRSRR